MIFDEYIGHKDIIANIRRAIRENRFAHAHLIVGEDGIGKSHMAKAIALEIMGIDINREHVDILTWKIEKNKKSIGVNEIRELIKEVSKRPFEGDQKVIIVHDGDKMTPQAQNAFLKTIEEPPAGVFILILTESIDKILVTIRSRCQIHNLRKINNEQVKQIIMRENEVIAEEMLSTVINFSEGIPGKAQKFLKDEDFKEIRKFCLEFFEAQGKRDVLSFTSKILEYKDRWDDFYSCFVNLTRDMVIIKECDDKNMIINKDYGDIIQDISENYSYKSLNKMLYTINKTNKKVIKNLNFNIAIEVMMLELQEV